MKDSEKLEFKVKNQEIEKKLNIGIFQFEDYLAFYINLTAYDEHINSQESTNCPEFHTKIRPVRISENYKKNADFGLVRIF